MGNPGVSDGPQNPSDSRMQSMVSSGSVQSPPTSPPVVAVHNAQVHDRAEVDLRMTNVNSIFYLSLEENFSCDLEAYAAYPVGKICIVRRNKLIVRYGDFNGKCEITTNGIVRTYGQVTFVDANGKFSVLSSKIQFTFARICHSDFEEADAIAMRVVSEFVHLCKANVGLNKHTYIIAHFAAQLPWNINLMRMSKQCPTVQFEPELNAFAGIKFDDLEAVVGLYTSGKLVMSCTGDCHTRDTNMPKALEALERTGALASCFAILGSLRDSVVIEDAPIEEIMGISMRRRSHRVPEGRSESPDNVSSPAAALPPEKSNFRPTEDVLNPAEERVTQLLKLVDKNRSAGEIRHILSGIAQIMEKETERNDNISISSLRKVAACFGVMKLFPDPVEPIPEPLRTRRGQYDMDQPSSRRKH